LISETARRRSRPLRTRLSLRPSVDAPYEVPLEPAVRIPTMQIDVAEAVERILRALDRAAERAVTN
jgi:adenylylsulfate kinase-like enzyme